MCTYRKSRECVAVFISNLSVDVRSQAKSSWVVYVGKFVCNKMLRMDRKIIRRYILRVTKVVDECIMYIYLL